MRLSTAIPQSSAPVRVRSRNRWSIRLCVWVRRPGARECLRAADLLVFRAPWWLGLRMWFVVGGWCGCKRLCPRLCSFVQLHACHPCPGAAGTMKPSKMVPCMSVGLYHAVFCVGPIIHDHNGPCLLFRSSGDDTFPTCPPGTDRAKFSAHLPGSGTGCGGEGK